MKNINGGGYADDYSMSERALDAYSEGKLPISKVKRSHLMEYGINVSLSFFKELVDKGIIKPYEWHHSSSWYNEVNFFDLEDCKEQIENKKEQIEQLKKDKKKEKAKVYTNQVVTYLDWYGTRSHPKCEEVTLHDCKVIVKGKTATIMTKDGFSFQKRLSTNGFYFENEKK